MNITITVFHVAMSDHKVVLFDTTLKKFVAAFQKIEPTCRNYHWFYRKFKASAYFNLTILGKEYYFQKLK